MERQNMSSISWIWSWTERRDLSSIKLWNWLVTVLPSPSPSTSLCPTSVNYLTTWSSSCVTWVTSQYEDVSSRVDSCQHCVDCCQFNFLQELKLIFAIGVLALSDDRKGIHTACLPLQSPKLPVHGEHKQQLRGQTCMHTSYVFFAIWLSCSIGELA